MFGFLYIKHNEDLILRKMVCYTFSKLGMSAHRKKIEKKCPAFHLKTFNAKAKAVNGGVYSLASNSACGP